MVRGNGVDGARPFSVGWYAVSDGELPRFPRGALIRYREYYGSDGQPNVGLRLPAEDVAKNIETKKSRAALVVQPDSVWIIDDE